MAPKAAPGERRLDPTDGKAYSFEELKAFYANQFTQVAIKTYWDSLAASQGRRSTEGSNTAAKAKAKATAKAKGKWRATVEPSRKPLEPDAVIARLTDCKVVPVVTIQEPAHAEPLAKALLEGGAKAIEITFRSSHAAEAIRVTSKSVEGMLVGAGTVLTASQVDEAVDAGADFVVSPGFHIAVARRCRARGVLYLPGVVTPTEVMTVTPRFKLKVVKFFPASSFGGVGTLKSYAPIFADVKFMPTGGVTEANVGEYLALPNVFAVGGSWMVGHDAVAQSAASGDWSAITKGTQEAYRAAGVPNS